MRLQLVMVAISVFTSSAVLSSNQKMDWEDGRNLGPVDRKSLDVSKLRKDLDCDETNFLLDNMGNNDHQLVSADFLLQDIQLAKKIRMDSESVWGPISDEMFQDNVLPFKIATEKVSLWRDSFNKLWWDKVKGKSKGEAVKFINREAFQFLNVTYRKEYPGHVPDQDPFTSQKLHYASCTGLSIILASACRSVGIPARLTMTPAWVKGSDPAAGKNGLSDEDENHSWVEVNIGGRWHYIGASEDTDFDNTWFTAQAASAIHSTAEKYKHGIYTVSFKKTDMQIPAPWNTQETVNVIEVTDNYKKKAE